MKDPLERIAESLQLLVYAECLKSLDFAELALGPDSQRVRNLLDKGMHAHATGEVRKIVRERLAR